MSIEGHAGAGGPALLASMLLSIVGVPGTSASELLIGLLGDSKERDVAEIILSHLLTTCLI